MRGAIPCLIAALLLASPAPARAADAATIGDNAFDVVVLRPLGAIGLLVGSILFVPTVLLTAPSGRDGIDEATEIFITPQWDAVATRPLGEF
jgi:hypothetical protein